MLALDIFIGFIGFELCKKFTDSHACTKVLSLCVFVGGKFVYMCVVHSCICGFCSCVFLLCAFVHFYICAFVHLCIFVFVHVCICVFLRCAFLHCAFVYLCIFTFVHLCTPVASLLILAPAKFWKEAVSTVSVANHNQR